MKLTKPTVITLIVIVAAMVLVAFITISPSSSTGSGEYNAFAQCLTEKGVKMYGAYWCPHCQEQKERFGDAWPSIDYVECSYQPRTNEQRPECAAEGIVGYPTWVFADGSRIESVVTLGQLSLKTGCALP